MGIDISLLVATLLVIGTLTFAALIPSLPASVGTFEFAVYYFLATIGVSSGEALGFALVIHAILFLLPILIAVLVSGSWTLIGQSRSPANTKITATEALAAQSPPAASLAAPAIGRHLPLQ